VNELARELGVDDHAVIALAEQLKIGIKSHASTLDDPSADRIRRLADSQGLRREPIVDDPHGVDPPKTAQSAFAPPASSANAHVARRGSRRKLIRVYELARELGVTNGVILDLAQPLGIKILSHSSSIDDASADRIRRLADVQGSRSDSSAVAPTAHAPIGSREIPEVDRAPVAWRLRAWDDPQIQRRWLKENVVSMSSDEIGSVSAAVSDEELRRRLEVAFPERSANAVRLFVRYWRSFLTGMRSGDVVVVPLKDHRAALGEIVGSYVNRPDESDPRLRHQRSVKWLLICPRDAIDADIRRVVDAPGTLAEIHASNASLRLRRTPTSSPEVKAAPSGSVMPRRILRQPDSATARETKPEPKRRARLKVATLCPSCGKHSQTSLGRCTWCGTSFRSPPSSDSPTRHRQGPSFKESEPPESLRTPELAQGAWYPTVGTVIETQNGRGPVESIDDRGILVRLGDATLRVGYGDRVSVSGRSRILTRAKDQA
jgi:hypothetical protein